MTRGMRRSRRQVTAVALLTLMVTAGLVAPAGAADTPGEGPERLLPLWLGPMLPGTPSKPMAIDGDLVVGDAVAGYGPRWWDDEFDRWKRDSLDHAVVWDITDINAGPRDLGTLGGSESHAVAVDGTWVVGRAETGDGRDHAFAVDVAADNPTMLDLGTLPGYTSSWATAVSDGIVVGTSSDGRTGQAFAVDLKAAVPQMVPLGDLGDGSDAAAVDNGIVVGRAFSPKDERWHVFAVDLTSPDPVVRDLGHVGGRGLPSNLAVDDGIVVGSAPTIEGSEHAFVVDLTAADATMRDLYFGELRTSSWPTDVESGLVVGSGRNLVTGAMFGFVYDVATGSRRQLSKSVIDVDNHGSAIGIEFDGDGATRAFMFDATAGEPVLVDRGVLVSFAGVWPIPSDEQVLINTDDYGHAAVWPVGETVRVHGSPPRASESAGAVRVRVLRTGDLTLPASVRYRTAGGSARADVDFTSRAGTLNFAAGQSEATIKIPVRDDSRAEPVERFAVRLTQPSGGQRLLTSEAIVTLRESDQRPDLEVSTTARRGYVGDGVHNGTAARQTRTAAVRRGSTRSFYVRLHNDHNAAITTSVRPEQVPAGVRVRYLHAGQDITEAVTGPGGWNVTVRPGRRVLVRLEVVAGGVLPPGATRTVKVAAIWSGDQTRRDVVGAMTRIRR